MTDTWYVPFRPLESNFFRNILQGVEPFRVSICQHAFRTIGKSGTSINRVI